MKLCRKDTFFDFKISENFARYHSLILSDVRDPCCVQVGEMPDFERKSDNNLQK